MQGYCVRCRSKQEMLSATRTLMKNGRRAMIGVCDCCGTKMSVAGVWDSDPVPAAAPAFADVRTSPESAAATPNRVPSV